MERKLTGMEHLGARPNTVKLLGWYGGDETHSMSAWTSTSRDELDAVERKTGKPKRDRIPRLLRMLATSDPPHTAPFEKSMLHFLVDSEKASHIHLIKHRIAVSVNAESARYKELKEDRWFYPTDWPAVADYRNAAAEGPGSLAAVQAHNAQITEIQAAYEYAVRHAHETYHDLVEKVAAWNLAQMHARGEVSAANSAEMEQAARKRAKESARLVLPHASMVMQDVSFNFLSFRHFLKLRHHHHAQREIREIAAEMLRLVKAIPGNPFEHSLAAFGL